MKALRYVLVVMLAVAYATARASAPPPPEQIAWQPWSEALFLRAQKENRFVILDLQAIWCHWCHVMDQTTYQDGRVRKLIGAKYIAVRVDQDADPALSVRYQDYGWPATVVFAPDGTEIVKRRGYLSPQQMGSLLDAIIKDPSPGPSVAAQEIVTPRSAVLSPRQRSQLLETYFAAFDAQYAGWGSVQKFIDADSLEYALDHAATDARQAAMARRTLDAALALIDPVWGGVYQYSDRRDWRSPHFEKIMAFQTQYIRAYAQAYRSLGDPRYLRAAQAIDRYLEQFMQSPAGAFYTSQDADVNADLTGHVFYAMSDAQRRAHPNPRIDTHQYARENGWAIVALTALFDATGEQRYLLRAQRCAQWVLANRALAGGGFSHDGAVVAIPALGDTLAMGQGFLALYVSTGEKAWLTHASDAARFIAAHFAVAQAGYSTVGVAAHARGVFKESVRDIDENVALARFANSLSYYTAQARERQMARAALRYLAAPQIADGEHLRTGILLADDELSREPTHVTIVGHKDDASALMLHSAALRYPADYRRIEWWDKREGAMPNPDVQYPELAKSAAFICSNKTCSLPVFDSSGLTRTIEELSKPAL